MKDAGVEKAHKVLQQVSEDPVARRLAEQRALAAITWKMDIDAVREETRIEEIRSSIGDLCEVLGIELTETQRASLADMTLTELDELRQRIKKERRWPE